MNSEKNTLKLIDMLDKAVDEIEKIDKRLREYEEKISAVGDAVRIVGERDNVIQLQQTNQNALLGLLNNMISSLEFSVENKRLLASCELKDEASVRRCVDAANQLSDILEKEIAIGLRKMKAYEDQIKFLENLKHKFCATATVHLKNAIGYLVTIILTRFKGEQMKSKDIWVCVLLRPIDTWIATR